MLNDKIKYRNNQSWPRAWFGPLVSVWHCPFFPRSLTLSPAGRSVRITPVTRLRAPPHFGQRRCSLDWGRTARISRTQRFKPLTIRSYSSKDSGGGPRQISSTLARFFSFLFFFSYFLYSHVFLYINIFKISVARSLFIEIEYFLDCPVFKKSLTICKSTNHSQKEKKSGFSLWVWFQENPLPWSTHCPWYETSPDVIIYIF